MGLLVNRLPPGPYYGILAEFATPADLYHACERVRDAGFTRWDAHTPFPVHGLERAMGLPRSPLPWIVLGMGLTGAALGFILQWWVHAAAYPLVISGKPYFSWPAFIPITFEVSVLFAMSIIINIGMWFERFVIIVSSLHRDFLPSAWGYFSPTIWDVSCLLGSFGLFFTMFCLFVRFLPMVATSEVKTVLPQADPHPEGAS